VKDKQLSEISKSAILAYKFCPLKYKFQFIDDEEPVESLESQIGTEFHRFATLFFEELDYHSLAGCRDYDSIMRIFELYLTGLPEAVLNLARNFIDMEAKRFLLLKSLGKVAYYKPLEVEGYYETQINNFKLVGHIDRIDTTPDGNVMIVEYKTSKKMRFQS